MSLRIEIKSDALNRREITIKNGPRAGQITNFYEQEAWVTLPGNDGKPRPFPQRIVLNIDVDRNQQAWPVGVYTLSDAAFFIDRFNALTIGRIVLTPLAAAQQPSRAA